MCSFWPMGGVASGTMSMRVWIVPIVGFKLLMGWKDKRKPAIFYTNLRKLSCPPLKGDKLDDEYPENTEKTKRQ